MCRTAPTQLEKSTDVLFILRRFFFNVLFVCFAVIGAGGSGGVAAVLVFPMGNTVIRNINNSYGWQIVLCWRISVR